MALTRGFAGSLRESSETFAWSEYLEDVVAFVAAVELMDIGARGAEGGAGAVGVEVA